MELIDKHIKRVMKNHPEISRAEATAIAENFRCLSIMIIDNYLEQKSSTNTIAIDN